MEEIYSISKMYYKTCVDLRLLKIKGTLYFLPGLFFMILTLHWILKNHNLQNTTENHYLVTQILGMTFWLFAKREYEKNLTTRLKLKTQSEASELKIQKVLYLKSLTLHIGSRFFEVLKNISETQRFYKTNRSFSPDNFGYLFTSFIYDPDSKNRILSLLIYFISLIALLTVVKQENPVSIYSIIDQLDYNSIIGLFGWSAFFIILMFSLAMWMFIIAFSYVISPVMLFFSNQRFLLRFLMSELSKYAFLDKKLENVEDPF